MKCLLACLLLLNTAFAQKHPNSFGSVGLTSLINEGLYSWGVSTNFGFGISQAASFGVGVDFYKFKETKTPYIPLYLHLKFYLNEKAVRPYITLGSGYGLYNAREVTGGLYYVASAGAHLRVVKKNERSGPYIQAGIKRLTFNAKKSTKSISGNFFSLDLGFRF